MTQTNRALAAEMAELLHWIEPEAQIRALMGEMIDFVPHNIRNLISGSANFENAIWWGILCTATDRAQEQRFSWRSKRSYH